MHPALKENISLQEVLQLLFRSSVSDLSLTVQVTLSQVTCLLEVTGSNPDLPFFTVTSLQVKTENE